MRYMFDKYGPHSVRDVANWCVWTMNSKLPFPENGTFDRDCLNHLRNVLEEKGSTYIEEMMERSQIGGPTP